MEKKIVIAVEKNRECVRVEVPVKSVNGPIAIHREYMGGGNWAVTHIPSGFAIAQGFRTLKAARLAASIASDWALDLGLANLNTEESVLAAFQQCKRDGKTPGALVAHRVLRDIRNEYPLDQESINKARNLIPYA